MAIKAVIFDLDGTITQPYFDFDAIRAEMGLTREDGPVWEAMMRMSPQQRTQSHTILDHYEQKGVDESTLNDGADETLKTLRNRDIKIGILTRNKADNVRAVAEKHGLHFDEILGREDRPVKPDAYGVLELCTRFKIEPSEAMMVGDYLFDIQCGNGAGAVSVLLANHRDASEFEHLADHTICRINEIIDIIEERS